MTERKFEGLVFSWPVVGATTAGLPVFGVMVGLAHGWAKVPWTLGVIVLALGSGYLAWLRDKRAKEAREEADAQRQAAEAKAEDSRQVAQRFARTFTGAGQPLVASLAVLCAGSGDPKQDLVSLTERVLQVVRRLVGTEPGDNRAVFFERQGADVLIRRNWIGRRDEPRRCFERSDVPHGRSVLEFVEGNDLVDHCDDVTANPPPGFDLRGCSYRSFIAVPVSAGSKTYGMLGVDSLDIGNFAKTTDGGVMLLLAGLLGAGIAAAERAQPPR